MGFSMTEIMEGVHHFSPDYSDDTSERAMKFEVVWGSMSMTEFLNPASPNFLTATLKGEVSIEGLCEKALCAGTLKLNYFVDNTIEYNFTFQDFTGIRYYYTGKKVNIKPWNLPTSHTTCFGTVVEEGTGKLVSTSTTFFKFKRIPSFLLSLRYV